MALIKTLTEPIEKKNGLFAIERMSLAYNAFTTVLIGIFYMQLRTPGAQLIERMGIVGMTALCYVLYHWRPCRLTTFVRVVSQMFLLAYWYPDTICATAYSGLFFKNSPTILSFSRSKIEQVE